MCGIAGVFTTDSSSPAGRIMERLEDALAHRGPDGRGRHDGAGISMIHARLSIIDLETGGQPIYAEDAALIANGEIYNYLELRDGLDGCVLTTRSDCEPALLLYLRCGVDFTDHLRGMYAIAIHDARRDRLVLARDPFGIKPLYYAATDLGFVFASEPPAPPPAGG